MRLTGTDAVWDFVHAGNATITLVSSMTGNRFTYRIKECAGKRGLFFVGLLTGPDNTEHYQYLGTIRDNQFERGKRSRIGEEAQSVKVFHWFWRQLYERNVLPPLLECWHSGRCGRCNRKLTVPQSIATGLGPECATRRAV